MVEWKFKNSTILCFLNFWIRRKSWKSAHLFILLRSYGESGKPRSPKGAEHRRMNCPMGSKKTWSKIHVKFHISMFPVSLTVSRSVFVPSQLVVHVCFFLLYPGISLDLHGYPCISMDLHVYPFISMDMLGNTWISIDTWISITRRGRWCSSNHACHKRQNGIHPRIPRIVSLNPPFGTSLPRAPGGQDDVSSKKRSNNSKWRVP